MKRNGGVKDAFEITRESCPGRNRQSLLGGASRLALHIIPFAVALGVAQAQQAGAATLTVNPVQAATYNLSPGANPITFGAGTKIDTSAASGNAVYGDSSTHWTVNNAGVLKGYSNGVLLQSPSSVTNTGTIAGGTSSGLVIGGYATVTNSGVITSPGDDGVDIEGGIFTNKQGGVVTGLFAGVASEGPATASIVNAGTISGREGFGVAVANTSGSVTNQTGGTITGTAGVELYGTATVLTNSGVVVGGVDVFGAGARVNNLAGATITNNGYGVLTFGHGGTSITTNAGTIAGYLGVALRDGGTVINQAGGVISGTFAGVAAFGERPSEINVINNLAGATITGVDHGIYVNSNTAAVTNAGTIFALKYDGIFLLDGGTINNQANGKILGPGYGVFVSGAAGTVINAGSIGGSATAAAWFANGGSLNNQAGGKISGAGLGVAIFSTGSGSVTNAGSITQTGGAGGGVFPSGDAVLLSGGGSVTNAAGGAISAGGTAVLITVGAGSVTNAGTLRGGTAAVQFQGSGANTLTNSGLITTTQLGHVGLAIGAAGGTFSNSKTGVIDGLIGGSGAITLNNAGTWDVNGASTFGAGSFRGGLYNTGTIQVGLTTSIPAAKTSSFNGLSIFANGSSTATGVISLENGTAGDMLTIAAPFVGASGHSILYLDAFLGGRGSIADQLHLTSGSSGQTLIRIHDTNSGAGAVNNAGIVLVTGVTSASNFALDPTGPGYDLKHHGIDHSLFLYSLSYANGDEVLIGSKGAGATQLPSVITAGQQIWAATSFAPDHQSGPNSAAGFGEVGFDRPPVWLAAVDGLVDTSVETGLLTSSPSAVNGEAGPAPAVRLSAMQSNSGFDTSYDLGVAMLTGGVDLVRHQGVASAWSLGVASAYVKSDQRFNVGAVTLDYSGVAFGGYASYRAASLYVDATVKSDLLKARYTAQWLGANQAGASMNATGAELAVGYRYALNTWLVVEPLASAAFERTSMGDLRLGSSIANFDPANSGWANVGVRLSGDVRRGAYSIKGSATARVWSSFGATNTAVLSDLGPMSPLNDNLGGLSEEVGGDLTISKGRWAEGFVSSSIRQDATHAAMRAVAGFRLSW